MHVAGFAVFGASMILLYAASAAYHLLPVSAPLADRLRRVDHSAIYVFIAGCYTPVCLLPLRAAGGAWWLALVWSLALLGVALKLVWLESSRWLRIGLYLGLGWLGVAILPSLLPRLDRGGVACLAAEAAAYTVGSLVYASKRPDPFPRVLGFHEIWHLFVIAGSACHFLLVKGSLLGLP
jgi:hemolysin III